ncbi:hypothetical protein BO94DRAFT_584940 [Aspergillus sclerotioniger CBS 115572]|uniref:NAD(P)-binding protein n=1 Tax=Aspergillus sclerotioniger CBS 115572 TaxID=1450535 RepID=A0A317WZR2_9EURO|nr:hypothetical protein BO94DRAFT_584940 [Aspergillus sclerotioniger CBS 115572]PWY89700.1 hypothetical protein BO94DRAFT_584940 [Aspergillus sclerotioniger CBS 115572]
MNRYAVSNADSQAPGMPDPPPFKSFLTSAWTGASFARTPGARPGITGQTDNASLVRIRRAAATILAALRDGMHLLVNNAGVMSIPDLRLTEDGHETHFATNYLGHFLLFQRSNQPYWPARIRVLLRGWSWWLDPPP